LDASGSDAKCREVSLVDVCLEKMEATGIAPEGTVPQVVSMTLASNMGVGGFTMAAPMRASQSLSRAGNACRGMSSRRSCNWCGAEANHACRMAARPPPPRRSLLTLVATITYGVPGTRATITYGVPGTPAVRANGHGSLPPRLRRAGRRTPRPSGGPARMTNP